MTEISQTSSDEIKRELKEEQIEGRRDLVRALVLCLMAVVLVRSFLFEPFKIPSSSMVPTLRIGDHIFVSKFNFGLSVPYFTKTKFASWGAPRRGEVIVFLFPRDESLHYIKRVVGVPGDKIEFKGKDIFINGKRVLKERVEDPSVIEKVTGSRTISGELYKETLGSSVHYVKYTTGAANDFSRNNQVEVVPDNKFFVVGDNRDDSYDSRNWGLVPRENIEGKAQMIWLSLDQEQSWGKLNKVRWERCGILVP
jgi:signal peptidase I